MMRCDFESIQCRVCGKYILGTAPIHKQCTCNGREPTPLVGREARCPVCGWVRWNAGGFELDCVCEPMGIRPGLTKFVVTAQGHGPLVPVEPGKAKEPKKKTVGEFLNDFAKEMKHAAEQTIEFVPPRFVGAIAECFERGIKDGRVANGWKNLEWSAETRQTYFAKLIGHASSAMRSEPKEACEHIAAVAANACIIWHHTKKGEK